MSTQPVMMHEQAPPAVVMMQKLIGFWQSKSISIAANLGIADVLKDGPKSAEEIAKATGAHASSVYRLMRALVSVGVFRSAPGGRFAQNELSEVLRSDVPGSFRASAITLLDPGHFLAWGAMLEAVKTGETAFDTAFGMPVWEYFAQHPEESQVFQQAMTSLGSITGPAAVAAYDFTPYKRIADIGGGSASLIAEILKVNTHARGVLQDLPETTPVSRKALDHYGLADRTEVVDGNFFETIVPGCDLYVMRFIIHDWDDEKSVIILRNIRNAMPESAKLCILDAVIPEDDEPFDWKFMDLNMLAMVGGKERTATEFRELLAAAGFRLTKIVPTHSPMSVIEAVPMRS